MSIQPAFLGWYDREEAPAQGSTADSLATSRTGAEAADRVRSRNLDVLLNLWREPKTMHDVAALSGLPLSSVCSLKAALVGDLVWHSKETKAWPDGRTTQRSRWIRKS